MCRRQVMGWETLLVWRLAQEGRLKMLVGCASPQYVARGMLAVSYQRCQVQQRPVAWRALVQGVTADGLGRHSGQMFENFLRWLKKERASRSGRPNTICAGDTLQSGSGVLHS